MTQKRLTEPDVVALETQPSHGRDRIGITSRPQESYLHLKKEVEMRGFPMTIGRLLALVAVIIFILASIGEWPSSLRDDFEPIALGLAFLAASFVAP